MKPTSNLKQRLLYLHAGSTHPAALVLAAVFVEPVAGGAHIELQAEPKMPYNTVHEALCDGWRIVQFPIPFPFADREINVAGYEFILEKMEEFDA